MNVTEAVNRACEEPTLFLAMRWIAVWETDRIVRQVRKNTCCEYDSCYGTCFSLLRDEWQKRHGNTTL